MEAAYRRLSVLPLPLVGLFKDGQTQFGLGRYDQAIAAYQSLAANYPNTPEAQEAQFQIIQSYFNKGDVRGAYQQFSAFSNAYPTDPRIKQMAETLLAAYQNQGSNSLHSPGNQRSSGAKRRAARPRPKSYGNAGRAL